MSDYVSGPPILRSQRYYLAPQHDIQTPLLALVNGAQKTIDIEIYGYTWRPLHDALIAAHKRGVQVRILFDHTQACGPSEKALVTEIEAAGIECWTGTSPQHQIRHSKVMVVDGRIVEKGSLNYSATALLQNNTVDLVEDTELAALHTADWEANKAWLIANEGKYQVTAPPTAPRD